MKYFMILGLLMCLILTAQGYCTKSNECGEGQCCTGGFYHRYCKRLGNDGEPCQKPNQYDEYKFGCPCKEGLECSAINYCQKPF